MPQKKRNKSETPQSQTQTASNTGGQVIQAGRDVIISQPKSESKDRKGFGKRIARWLGIFAAVFGIIISVWQVWQDNGSSLGARYYGVVEDDSGRGVADATIEIKDASNSTNILGIGQTHSNGEFSILIKAKPGSTVWVKVSKAGYKEIAGMKSLGGNDKVTLSALRREP